MEHGESVETQASICAWSNATFGSAATNLRLASRANEELAEAVRAYAADPNSVDSANEAGDTIIVLCVLADRFGVCFNDFTENDTCRLGSTPGQLLMDANSFMACLLDGLLHNDNDRTATHWIYGCYQKLCWFIRRMGLEPGRVIDEKMVINRARKWQTNSDGMQVRPEKIAVKAIEPEDGWVSAGTFSGWPVAVPVATPAPVVQALEGRLNNQHDYSLSMLF